jgi:hypothetical protein
MSFKPLDTKTLSGNLGAFAGNGTESNRVEKIRITTKLMSEKYNGKTHSKRKSNMNLNSTQSFKELGIIIRILLSIQLNQRE